MESLMYRDINEEIRTRAYEWYKDNINKPYESLQAKESYYNWLDQQGVIYPNVGAPRFKDERSKTIFLLRWS